MLVDSVIALTSTTYPQLKHILNSAYEASVSYITGAGLGLIVEAVVRHDQGYIKDQMYGPEDENMAEEESSEDEE